MEALLLMVMGLTNIACFMIGVNVRQKVDRGEEVKLPTLNPMEIQREKQAKHEAEMEKSRLDTILRNIDNYDGTDYRQEEVPGR